MFHLAGTNVALTVENCLFTGGIDANGMIYAINAYSSTIAISNSVFASCGNVATSTSAVKVGGSTKAKPTKLTVKSTLFENLLGDPIYLIEAGTTASITGSTFKNNVGSFSGAVRAGTDAGAVSQSGNTFKNNKCTNTKSNCKASGFCKMVSSGRCQ